MAPMRDQDLRAFLEAHPNAVRRYLKVMLRADAAIKADMPKAVEVLDAGKYYRVDKATLNAALPRQMPQVDITRGGDKGMEIAVADMVTRASQDAARNRRHDLAKRALG